ncbi:MAG: ABC transporter ATP-binding protein [Gemmatimonadota bacterium]|nr:ABC transporter ATP-binding protein [Gemmatimonadota bacterium]MDH3367281.1 ABC transporter ATP-binding protein [Gemmatimonadota bacterium]MDH3479544.1 ABC transporter ATP-binding protein [Gemmatimonadota bacterium]MDH3568724.1 ABC transporter ATP-binding protein [Gemmatimonadota bacterium]MDH5549725.1 ABC transporter ATP-binding protein [Gemmatimonadota bacterium]
MGRILAAESIGKRFGRRWVLESAGLWATPGRVSVLLGRNGSGKTTILRIAIGRLRPSYGIVIFAGERLDRPRLPDLAVRGLFYLPSDRFLCDRYSVREHLAALAHRFPAAAVDDALEMLRLAPFLDRRPPTLSGGEARRAEVALALARQPRCLLADEPFTGLMPTDVELLAEAFRRLAAAGCGLVLTGHEVRPLLAAADDVYWMTAGTTHLLGSPADARGHRQFQREYLCGREHGRS